MPQDVPINPLVIPDPDIFIDPFWQDMQPDHEDLAMLPHRVNILKPGGNISPTTGATLQGTEADGETVTASGVACLVEEVAGSEREEWERRTVYCTHSLYFGVAVQSVFGVNIDWVIAWANGRRFRVVYFYDPAGEGQGVFPIVLVKEE